MSGAVRLGLIIMLPEPATGDAYKRVMLMKIRMPIYHPHLAPCIIITLFFTSSLAANCPANQYNNAAGTCVQCPTPEQFSAGGSVTACTACAPGTKASGASCTPCTAGTFSAFKGSTTCSACPAGMGSVAGASACIRCGDSAARLANGVTPVPASCTTTTCSACIAGKYNDGTTKKCSSCVAGKVSPSPQATSVASCSPCPAGQTTLATTTGASACITCIDANITTPLSANHIMASDSLLCSWSCSPGYTRFNSSESTYVASVFTALGYSSTQSLAIFHNSNDFCCEPSTVKVGMYMCGTHPPTCTPACTRTSDGDSATCAPVANAHFVDGGTNRFNRCNDWECDEFFFLNKTSNVCTPQPVCSANYTYQRDSISGQYVAQPSGSFTCVPCSQCIDGSEVDTACDRFNDTACRMCSPTAFSFQASVCSSTIPFGFSPVRIRLTAIPVYQGRPSTFYDSSTPIPWTSIDFTQGFFLNSYTPCQPAASVALMFIGGDETCNKLDISPPTKCALPLCKTQCRPWNGVEGWYKLKTGECSPCTYDPTCTSLQYTDMTTCGPSTAPKCTNCPTIPLPNALRWTNPGRVGFPGPYPCDFVCRDGFTKSATYSCIPCPLLPKNAKIIGGCNWTCSLGFLQEGPSTCIPCADVPASCSTGYFLGYAAATSQCARCMPCTNLVADAVYTSTGQPNGPNTCGMECVPGTYVSPGYGFDSYNNPVACDRCSAPVCETGSTFLKPCSSLADAECIPCSQCAIGSRVLSDCSITTDTVCTPCDDTTLLPANAIWTEPGCERWVCAEGFVREPNATLCLKCKTPSDCIASDSFDGESSSCGRCVACDPFLLLPGQCFNGDGQCGVSYWCEGMDTAAYAEIMTTPAPDIAAQAVAFIMTSTNQAAAETPTQILAYASMATLTLEASTDEITPAFIADINTQVSADCACEATVTAMTLDNITTFCSAAGCFLPSSSLSHQQTPSRRLLTDAAEITLDITFVSTAPLTHAPQQPVVSRHGPHGRVLAWQPYACQPISDPVYVHDRRRLAVHFKRTGKRWTAEQTAESWQQYYLVVGIIAAILFIALLGGGGGVYYVKVYEARGRYREVEEAKVGGEVGGMVSKYYQRTAKKQKIEDKLRFPTDW